MDTIKIDARDVNFWYGDFHALKGISMEIEEKSVVAFIGPSGCGKSTFLRLFNRMNDLIPATKDNSLASFARSIDSLHCRLPECQYHLSRKRRMLKGQG